MGWYQVQKDWEGYHSAASEEEKARWLFRRDVHLDQLEQSLKRREKALKTSLDASCPHGILILAKEAEEDLVQCLKAAPRVLYREAIDGRSFYLSGIYLIWDASGTLLYVGMSEAISTRLGQHIGNNGTLLSYIWAERGTQYERSKVIQEVLDTFTVAIIKASIGELPGLERAVQILLDPKYIGGAGLVKGVRHARKARVVSKDPGHPPAQ